MNLLPASPDRQSWLPLWIGTWSMSGLGWGATDERQGRQTLELAWEHGIRHFDTAGFYGRGAADRLIARTLASVRPATFISAKGGLRWVGAKVEHRADPRSIREDLYRSLDALRTDYIDMFSLHWPDPKVGLQDSIGALLDLQAEGLIRQPGVCNLSQQQIRAWCPPGGTLPHQVAFSPWRAPTELEAGMAEERCCNLVISPFEHGLLLPRAAPPGRKEFRSRHPLLQSSRATNLLTRLHNLDRLRRPGAVARAILAWIQARRDVHAVIAGPRRPDQLAALLDPFHLPAEETAVFDDLMAALQQTGAAAISSKSARIN